MTSIAKIEADTRSQLGWLHPVTAELSQLTPTPSTMIEFTAYDVRFAVFSDHFQMHQTGIAQWIKEHGDSVQAYMFVPDVYGEPDELVYRFEEQGRADALRAAFAPNKSAPPVSGLAVMARMPNRTDAEVMISVEDQGEMSLAEFFAKHVPEDSNEGEDRRMAIRHAMDGEYVFEDADGDLTLLVAKRTMLWPTDKQRR